MSTFVKDGLSHKHFNENSSSVTKKTICIHLKIYNKYI